MAKERLLDKKNSLIKEITSIHFELIKELEDFQKKCIRNEFGTRENTYRFLKKLDPNVLELEEKIFELAKIDLNIKDLDEGKIPKNSYELYSPGPDNNLSSFLKITPEILLNLGRREAEEVIKIYNSLSNLEEKHFENNLNRYDDISYLNTFARMSRLKTSIENLLLSDLIILKNF